MKYLFVAILLLTSSLCLSQAYFEETAPEEQGISSESLLKMVQRFETEVDAVHSFMVLRHGKLISKGWWDPYGPEIPHVMHSLSKSFTSTAIGFAVQEELVTLDDLVISFFPEKAPQNPSWHWNEMRIRDLITMNTGHLEEPRARNERDWVKFFLASEVDLLPGSVFKYNSMATYMLSAIITKVTGEKLVDYLNPRLFQPLGIEKPEWDEDPMGINTGGWGLHITTESIAKLGQFYLQKGSWEGKQLLAAEWIEMATAKQVSNGSNPDNDWMQGYGFQFWRCRHNAYRGDGAMGQFCIVMPDQDAIIAITSGLNDMSAILNIVWETLLPALQDESLDSDRDAYRLLVEKTKNLNLQTITGKNRSLLANEVSETFEVEPNNAGLKAVKLELSGSLPKIAFIMNAWAEELEIGYNAYIKNELVHHLPYADGLENKIASQGAWINDSTYQLRAYFYESPARINYTFFFENDQLTIETKLEHALFGRRDIVEFKGTVK